MSEREELTDTDIAIMNLNDPNTDLPVITSLIYRVCGNDKVKFDEGYRLLILAYEAGKAAR